MSQDQRAVLAALCDTVIARLSEADELRLGAEVPRRGSGAKVEEEDVRAFCRSTGSDLGVPEAVEAAVFAHLPADVQQEITLLLAAMSTRLGMLGLFGTLTPFQQLSPKEREACFVGLQDSKLSAKRKAFFALKSIISFCAFGRDTKAVNPHNQSRPRNIMWAAMDFDGPATTEEASRGGEGLLPEFKFSMLNSSIVRDATLECDVVIVGSGCGGAVVAAELAQSGQRVLVLEKSQYLTRSEMTGVESEAFGAMYERGGVILTEDTGMGVLAGSAFGGGSTINWSCSLRTPDHVKEEWAKEHGLTAFVDGSFDASLDAICKRVGVKSEGVAHNRNNQLFIDACNKLGYHVATAPQAMIDAGPNAQGANHIGNGDRHGVKSTAAATFLVDAAMAATPAQFIDRCYVERILHERGTARGVTAKVVGADGVTQYRLTILAPIVVSSCGSINSPALLLRSGLPNKNGMIGKNLRLHPVMSAVAMMPDGEPDVNVWRGAPMTTVSNVVAAGPTGNHYGAKLECPLTHPGVVSMSIPLQNATAFKEFALDFRRCMTMITLVRDSGSGEVKIDKNGIARIYYKINEHDTKSLMDGLEKTLHVMEAAGASKVITAHFKDWIELPPVTEPERRKEVVAQLAAEIRRIGAPTFKVQMFSAHQMGTCKMGSDPARSVVKPSCESWECSGLYIIDASAFPTSSGVNPMITTYGIAHMASQRLKQAAAEASSKTISGKPLSKL